MASPSQCVIMNLPIDNWSIFFIWKSVAEYGFTVWVRRSVDESCKTSSWVFLTSVNNMYTS